nr:type IV secretory system conjugative DNA transfer family protein [uncultured Lachnoanaerobaculum sp.]
MVENGLNYYDSRTATEEEFTEDLSASTLSDGTQQTKGGPILFRKDGKIYTDPSDLHNLIVGNTGSMKTLRFVLPLIYSSAMADESMIVVDPKGELVRKTHTFLKERGYQISVLNWRNTRLSPNSWNPMGRINKLYKSGKRGQEDAVNALNDLLDGLFNKRSNADKDKYWNESAGRLALGLCKLILAVDEELSLRKLLDWKNGKLKDGTVRSCFESLASDNDIYQNLSGYMNLTAENTKTCIESTFDQLTGIFSSSKALIEMMSEDTMELESIDLDKRAIFLVVPDEKTTYHFLVTLFIKHVYELLLEKADQNKGCLPIRMNFIMEEFCNMPKLDDLAPMLTAARSRNIRFHLVIQSYGQMVDKYGESISKTIMDNCGNLIYLHTNEISFLEYVSKLAGNNEYGRPLISVSRLQHLKRNETLIFHDRCYPFLVQNLPMIFEYPIVLGAEMLVRSERGLKKPLIGK